MSVALPVGWTRARVEDIASLVQYGSSAKTSEDASGIPVLRMANIVDGRLDFDRLKYLPKVHDGAIAVGHPGTRAPDGWEWVPLSRIARMESGHTPSREHSDYWDGGIPWIGIRDARENHGREITTTFQTVSKLGLENSASRLLPARTVCFSRTAPVGYVTIMGESMATSQDFANWTCSPALLPEYLMFALLAEGEHIKTFGEGSPHTTIYYPELKAFHLCLAPLEEQGEIVARVSRMLDVVARLIAEAGNQSQRQEALARSILAKAFRGELVPQDPNDQPAEAALLKSGKSAAPVKPRLESKGKRREAARSSGGRADARPSSVNSADSVCQIGPTADDGWLSAARRGLRRPKPQTLSAVFSSCSRCRKRG